MRYNFIKNNEHLFPIEKMCKVVEVVSSSYYKWKRRSASGRMLRKKRYNTKLRSFILRQNNVMAVQDPRAMLELAKQLLLNYMRWVIKYQGSLLHNI